MKVYNLQCHIGHGFEGWFSSEEDFEGQHQRGLVTCPFCDSPQVQRMPTAPRLNLNHGAGMGDAGEPHVQGTALNRESQTAPEPLTVSPDDKAQMLAAWLHVAKHVVENTVDVGTRFAQEASQMHHGEIPERPIRGQATPQEKAALREEGIEVMEMHLPAFITKPLQ